MANSGPRTNDCQAFVTCSKGAWLAGEHAVFGKITDGLLEMRKTVAAAISQAACGASVGRCSPERD